MIYTALTKKAMKVAYEAHHGQTDRSGTPYIFHPFHVAEQMDDELSVCTALLHDVVEDTEITFAKIYLWNRSHVCMEDINGHWKSFMMPGEFIFAQVILFSSSAFLYFINVL